MTATFILQTDNDLVAQLATSQMMTMLNDAPVFLPDGTEDSASDLRDYFAANPLPAVIGSAAKVFATGYDRTGVTVSDLDVKHV